MKSEKESANMKTKQIFLFLIGICLNSAAMATTIWAPTSPSDDVNVLLTTYYGDNGIIGLFDDSDSLFTSSALILNNNDVVSFVSNGSGYTATNGAGDSTFLFGSSNFILGMSLDNGLSWISDSATVDLTGGSAYELFFANAGQTILADVQAIAVSAPASILLFLIAFLPFMLYSRRRATFIPAVS